MTEIYGELSTLSIRGYSAYEIACQNGFEGTEKEWLESLELNFESKVENNILYYRIKGEWVKMLDLRNVFVTLNTLLERVTVLERVVKQLNDEGLPVNH